MALFTGVSGSGSAKRDKGFLAGVKRVVDWFLGRKKKLVKVTAKVGYKAEYAVYVHEAVAMKLKGFPRSSGIGKYWDPVPAQAKFLEKPARELSKELADDIAFGITVRKQTIQEAVMAAGLKLQRASQLLVPVEYGVLRNSAYTVIDEEEV